MSNTPNWAQDLVIEASIYLEAHGRKVALPVISWRHGARRSSSGHANPKGKTITITAGHDRTDQKMVLLHELAHIVIGCEPRYWNIERAKKSGWHFETEPTEPIVIKNLFHTPAFWDLAWDLYRWAKLPIRYCLNREKSYRKGAVLAYRRSR